VAEVYHAADGEGSSNDPGPILVADNRRPEVGATVERYVSGDAGSARQSALISSMWVYGGVTLGTSAGGFDMKHGSKEAESFELLGARTTDFPQVADPLALAPCPVGDCW
jgi:hypothetical protein